METTGEEEVDNEELDWEDAQEAMCPPGKHKWKNDLCMVCTVCRECTGYSISCLSSMRPDRNPGQWVNRICTVILKCWLMILNSPCHCHHYQLTFLPYWWQSDEVFSILLYTPINSPLMSVFMLSLLCFVSFPTWSLLVHSLPNGHLFNTLIFGGLEEILLLSIPLFS